MRVSEKPASRGHARRARVSRPLARPAAAPDRLTARPQSQHGVARWLHDEDNWTWLGLGVDVTMLGCAVAAALAGAGPAGVPMAHSAPLYAYPLLVIALLYVRGMYRRRLRIVVLDAVSHVIGATALAAMGIVALTVLTGLSAPPVALIARVWLFSMLYLCGGRVVLFRTQRRARREALLGTPALIVGAGAVGERVARRLASHPEYGLRPLGFIDADPPARDGRREHHVPVLGPPEELAEVAAQTGAEHVILAFSSAPDSALVALARRCEELGLEVSLVPRLFESINDRVAMEHLGGLPLLGLRTVDPKGWQFTVKHAIDRAAAALALLILSPVLAVVALGVKLSSPGPVLFRQRRVGRDGVEFDLLKFRSMREPLSAGERHFRPLRGVAPGGVEGDDRRTRWGRWLRRTSLDELPQLINVLRGDMSLVGPRPERPAFVDLFRHDVSRYGDRHRVKSGITGWAQVHGFRGQTSVVDRVEWDNYYIANWSLWLDLRILALTVLAMLQSEDA